ncbi:MAG: hypothetical protein R6U31_05895 [bacterium]
MKNKKKNVLINGSRLITESLARSGADAFVGYPITPANYLYLYSTQRMPEVYHAPDEITTLQWMAGLASTGKLPVTATSFPGFALMVESINMAYMMELPMVIILVQRLGPSTGTATCGAQGDISLINGLISGGYPVPAFSMSDFNDCWTLPALAAETAVKLRTPVVLLTSKEMVRTSRSFDIDSLASLEPVKREFYSLSEKFKPYHPEANDVPLMLPLGSDEHQVRFTASTHNEEGLLQHSSPEVLANTRRLDRKMKSNLNDYLQYEYDKGSDPDTIILSYGISAVSAREAVKEIRTDRDISLLIAKTMLPVPDVYYSILEKYRNIVIAEENLNGLYSEILFGKKRPANVHCVNSIGSMVSSKQIIEGVESYE